MISDICLVSLIRRETKACASRFERFVEQTPLTVMVRAVMERIFATEQLEHFSAWRDWAIDQ